MPTFKHSKDTVIKIATVAYQTIFKDITVPKEFAELDTTAFGDSGGTYIAGLENEDISITGMFSRTEFNALVALAGTVVAFEYHPEGTAAGTPKATCNVLVTSVAPKSTVGQLVELTFASKVTGGLTWGTN